MNIHYKKLTENCQNVPTTSTNACDTWAIRFHDLNDGVLLFSEANGDFVCPLPVFGDVQV